MSDVGVVAIGRNEGERLRRCLESLDGHGADGRLCRFGLDRRQRRAGAIPEHRGGRSGHVHTIHGRQGAECGLRTAVGRSTRVCASSSSSTAIAKSPTAGSSGRGGELERQPRAAVVFGLRRERFPEQSIYNRMADIEWNMPMRGADGTAQACGGDAMIRAEAFRSVGGYDPIGARRRGARALPAAPGGAAGSVWRVDADMTWHDAAMPRFRQWARRQFRTGYGGLDFTTRFGRGGTTRSVAVRAGPDLGVRLAARPLVGAGAAPGCSGGRSPAARPPG